MSFEIFVINLQFYSSFFDIHFSQLLPFFFKIPTFFFMKKMMIKFSHTTITTFNMSIFVNNSIAASPIAALCKNENRDSAATKSIKVCHSVATLYKTDLMTLKPIVFKMTNIIKQNVKIMMSIITKMICFLFV